MKDSGFFRKKREEARLVVLDYLRSGLGKKAYCALDSTKMNRATLSYWYKIYRANIAGDIDPYLKKKEEKEKRAKDKVAIPLHGKMLNKLNKIVFERRRDNLPNADLSALVSEAVEVFLKTEDKEAEIYITLRIPETLISEIDSYRNKQGGKISRNQWIVSCLAYLSKNTKEAEEIGGCFDVQEKS